MNLVLDFQTHVLPALVTGSVALFTFLVRSYFQKIDDTISGLGREIAKLEGKLEMLSKDLKDGTVESATLRSEVKALWRFADNSYQRSSDKKEYL